MTHSTCLNCDTELTDKFCAHCGQLADTHRISLKHFVFHDILHGTFHLEKGILFTAKESLIRPGQAALDYISGKRKRYYNVFYLILIMIGLILFLRHFNEVLDISQSKNIAEKPAYLNEVSRKLDEIFAQKSKIIIFLFVPFVALNSYLLFKVKKLNFSEHAIIAGMVLLGMLLISTAGNLFFYLDLIFPFSNTFADVMSIIVTILVLFHIGYGYYNAFASDYTKGQIALRLFLMFALLFIEILLLFFLVFGILSDWQFGKVEVSPF